MIIKRVHWATSDKPQAKFNQVCLDIWKNLPHVLYFLGIFHLNNDLDHAALCGKVQVAKWGSDKHLWWMHKSKGNMVLSLCTRSLHWFGPVLARVRGSSTWQALMTAWRHSAASHATAGLFSVPGARRGSSCMPRTSSPRGKGWNSTGKWRDQGGQQGKSREIPHHAAVQLCGLSECRCLPCLEDQSGFSTGLVFLLKALRSLPFGQSLVVLMLYGKE